MKASILFLFLFLFVNLSIQRRNIAARKISKVKDYESVSIPSAISIKPPGGPAKNIEKWWRESHLGYSYVSWRNQNILFAMRNIYRLNEERKDIILFLKEKIEDYALGNKGVINGPHLETPIPIGGVNKLVNGADPVEKKQGKNFCDSYQVNLHGPLMEIVKEKAFAADVRWRFSDTLDQIDIMRMNYNIHSLIDKQMNSFNDIYTIVNLSGGFYHRDSKGVFTLKFSGMIIEGQNAKNNELFVRTCFHGTKLRNNK